MANVKGCATVTDESCGRHALAMLVPAALVGVMFVCLLAFGVERAGATATVGATPQPGATGLPDGRLYEEVTPAYKNGNFYDALSNLTFGLASADGNAVIYPMSGAVGTSYAGMVNAYVSRRTPGSGWQTESVTSRPLSKDITIVAGPLSLTPSADFSRMLFTADAAYVAAEPTHEAGLASPSSVDIYLSGDPAVEPMWLGSPLISEPFPRPGDVEDRSYSIAGASANLETAYFTYAGTLVPEDAVRAANVLAHSAGGSEFEMSDPWGFYEWHAGKLVSAGVLPDGTLNPFGAVPAAIAGSSEDLQRGFPQAQGLDNEVSRDGSRAFFVSPDPAASSVTNEGICAKDPPCSSEPPELYVREPGPGGSRVSVLVSRSELAGHEGEAAAGGVVKAPFASREERSFEQGTYAYASPDGSQVFFASTDRLTGAAPENSEVKEYDFDTVTGDLTYVPRLSGAAIALSSSDGSELLFENRSVIPRTLELWRRGPGGGSVTDVTELPGPENPDLSQAHVSTDGSTFVFRTDAEIPGFNDSGGFEQVYRYDESTNELICLSCPPKGVSPSGDARMSYDNAETGVKGNGGFGDPATTLETRGMSANGSRVFFDTTSALVPQDTNGTRDVYEWENGAVYLVSSGANMEETYILDNSESGSDVFFATAQGLVPGDTDETYDVYDARIPHPGDNPPPSAVPCKGSICQGPPSVPQLLGAPASETFNGAGNVTPPAQATVKTRHRKKARARSKHRHRHRKHTHRRGARARKSTRPAALRQPASHVKHRSGRGK